MSSHIFFGVLNWGLGHAARSIPLIRAFRERGCNITVGSDGGALQMLKMEFPDLQFVELPSYKIRYQKSGALLPKLATQLPHMMRAVKQEHRLLDQAMTETRFDAVISDNRYGLWSKRIPTVLVTHQLKFRLTAGIQSIVNRGLRQMIARFDEVWIPDFEDEQQALTGELSHAEVGIEKKFIGPLSRFSGPADAGSAYQVVALVSGPEPQRSIFEGQLIKELAQLECKSLLLRGLPGVQKESHRGHLVVKNHLPTEELEEAIRSSRFVVARAGYSTIMDLVHLRRKALLVPTPGQSEQQYLTRYLHSRGWFVFQQQRELNIHQALLQLPALAGVFPNITAQRDKAIGEFLARLQLSHSGQYSSAIASL